ncbi:MAG TPA: hypothetical protein VJW20_06860 [Candidatus Angelobacter sp.]|nr:hypothetical protein [Candidatus Angelobacter sp.]
MVREIKLGPRRELTLAIELWPKGNHAFGGGPVITVRFGAISNYEEVKRFFEPLAVPSDLLHYLHYAAKPTPGKHVIEMEFDRSEAQIRIVAGKLSASEVRS